MLLTMLLIALYVPFTYNRFTKDLTYIYNTPFTRKKKNLSFLPNSIWIILVYFGNKVNFLKNYLLKNMRDWG
ncbi:protein of unknown function [Candidatus Nitrosacidococcus tergens]|uniref:Uncharacterized protein n=1 Tax=Candidatus Nitrosacidococcus tergens TaxID=553981 RepID=A0A7G1Q7I8_9GAMM|nr:protein of unknown function [Candidatus Nitrosacidococcus tergens]